MQWWERCHRDWHQRKVAVAPLPQVQVPSRYILGIDPGLRSTGFGLIEQTGNQLAYVASGCIKTDDKGTLPERLKTIALDRKSVV